MNKFKRYNDKHKSIKVKKEVAEKLEQVAEGGFKASVEKAILFYAEYLEKQKAA